MDDWDHPHPFLRRCVATAADIDALGHTNNTVYVRWCEETAWDHSAALGLDIDERIIGFIYVGTPQPPLEDKPRNPADAVSSAWEKPQDSEFAI